MSMSDWLPAAIGLLVAVVAFVICVERAYDAGYEQGFLHGRATRGRVANVSDAPSRRREVA